LDDLQRRDFTMNAIAMDHKWNIIDPFNGQQALKEKLIQTVGSAEERFTEDALRMMRAVRFVSTLSFTIESVTLIALKRHQNLLEKIAIERKRAEFEKLLAGLNRRNALRLLLEVGIYKFLPGFENREDVLTRLIECECEDLNINEMWLLIIYYLNATEKQEIEAFLKEWKLPVKQIKEIIRLFFFLKKRLAKQWDTYELYSAGKEAIVSVEKLYEVVTETKPHKGMDHWLELYEALPIKDRAQLKVTGTDLLSWFNQGGGPWVKEMIEKVELAIIMGEIKNEHLEIKEWLEKCSRK
ncbi:MAG: CCA tRNA nucleotidyltransferase, partial [Bacillota bacterium]|nr:CCA tRNA nucleotidyltransferase [Bacillota bacterium]